MTPEQKLAQLLDKKTGRFKPTWLGKQLEKNGLASGYNLLRKWVKGDREFLPRSQRLVERVCELPEFYFSEDAGAEPPAEATEAGDNAAQQSLFAFLASPRARELNPPAAAPEIVALAQQQFAEGEVPGPDYWYHTILARRARQRVPTQRPNMATDAASAGGYRKRAAKAPVKAPGATKKRGRATSA
jgi:hypothetical protein